MDSNHDKVIQSHYGRGWHNGIDLSAQVGDRCVFSESLMPLLIAMQLIQGSCGLIGLHVGQSLLCC
jgi:hypothetical protein